MHLEEKGAKKYHSWWLVSCNKLNIKQSVMTISVLYKVRIKSVILFKCGTFI